MLEGSDGRVTPLLRRSDSEEACDELGDDIEVAEGMLRLRVEVKEGDVPGKVMDGAFRVARHETHCITIRLTKEHNEAA